VDPLLTLPHLPVILFLGGALILIIGGATIPVRVKNAAILLIFVAVGVVLFLMRSQLPMDVVFSDWVTSLTLLGSLIYRIDAFNWSFALLLLVLLAALAWDLSTGNRPREDWRLMPALFFASSAAFSLLFSGNLLTLMFSWSLLTTAVFAFMVSGRGSVRTVTYLLVFWSLGIVLLTWATWSIGRGDGGRWTALAYSPTAARAIFVLAWISLAALPVHLWLASVEERPDILLPFLHAIPSLIGLYLLMRLAISQTVLPERELWIGVGAVSLLLAGELAWSRQDRLKTLSYIAIAQSGGVMLSLAISLPQATGLIFNWSLFLPFAMLVLFLIPARAGSADPAWLDWLFMAVTGLAGACLIGLPPTAGFAVWSQLNEAALSSTDLVVNMLLLALVFVAATLIAAAFFRIWLSPAAVILSSSEESPGLTEDVPSRRGWSRGVVGLLLLIPALAGGLLPAQLLADLTGGDGAGWGLRTYSYTEPGIWITVLLSACLGYVMSIWPPAMAASSHPLWQFFARLWNMAWLYRGIERLVDGGMGAVRVLVNMLYGEHWLLWAFLTLLLFLWFYLSL